MIGSLNQGAFDCAWVTSCTSIVTTGVNACIGTRDINYVGVNACTVIIITGVNAWIETGGFGCAGVKSSTVS